MYSHAVFHVYTLIVDYIYVYFGHFIVGLYIKAVILLNAVPILYM